MILNIIIPSYLVKDFPVVCFNFLAKPENTPQKGQNALAINTRRPSFMNTQMPHLQQGGKEKPSTTSTLEFWDRSSELRLEILLRWCLKTWRPGDTPCTHMDCFTSKPTFSFKNTLGNLASITVWAFQNGLSSV